MRGVFFLVTVLCVVLVMLLMAIRVWRRLWNSYQINRMLQECESEAYREHRASTRYENDDLF